jgi:hypothetical protein
MHLAREEEKERLYRAPFDAKGCRHVADDLTLVITALGRPLIAQSYEGNISTGTIVIRQSKRACQVKFTANNAFLSHPIYGDFMYTGQQCSAVSLEQQRSLLTTIIALPSSQQNITSCIQ